MADGRIVTWIVEGKCVEIALTLLFMGVIFTSLERFVTLFILADRRIINASLAVVARSADRDKMASVIGDHSCLLAMMLRRSLSPMSAGELRHSLDGEFDRLNRPTELLRLITAAAPLVGLLGTLLGTMVAMKSTDPRMGISTALSTTAIAIVVALISLLAVHVSDDRLRRLIDDIEDICGRRF